MGNTDLEKLIDAYNREIQVLDRTRHKHDVQGKQIAYLYKLSVAMQNTLRGLSVYDDAPEQFTVREQIQAQCLPEHFGTDSLTRKAKPQICVGILEDLAQEALNAGNAQLSRLKDQHASPNIQLELGVAGLQQLKPRNFAAYYNSKENVRVLEESLAQIQERLDHYTNRKPAMPQQWAERTNSHVATTDMDALTSLLSHTRDALASGQKLNHSTQAGLSYMVHCAKTYLKELDAAPDAPPEPTLQAIGTLLDLTVHGLMPSHTSNALKQKLDHFYSAKQGAQKS